LEGNWVVSRWGFPIPGCLEKAELLRHLEVAPDIVVEEENTGATIYEKEEPWRVVSTCFTPNFFTLFFKHVFSQTNRIDSTTFPHIFMFLLFF
jgi:hypothetical protein